MSESRYPGYPPGWNPPGSEEARAEGCICPVDDNHGGEGITRQGMQCWYTSIHCPVHGDEAKTREERADGT